MDTGSASIGSMINELEALKDEIKQMEAELAMHKARAEKVEEAIINAILDTAQSIGTSDMSITHNGRKYSVVQKNYYRIPAAARQVAFPALRRMGLGELISERVDDRTLTKELNAIEENNDGVLPDEYNCLMLETYSKAKLSSRKA